MKENAEISVAILLYGMIYILFSLLGNEEKRQYLLKHFPQIKPENIGCSRDTSFEKMVTEKTNGRGLYQLLI